MDINSLITSDKDIRNMLLEGLEIEIAYEIVGREKLIREAKKCLKGLTPQQMRRLAAMILRDRLDGKFFSIRVYIGNIK